MWREGREDYQLVSAFFFKSQYKTSFCTSIILYSFRRHTPTRKDDIYIYIYIIHVVVFYNSLKILVQNRYKS